MLKFLEFLFYCIRWFIEHWLVMIFVMGGVVLVFVAVIYFLFKGNNDNSK